MMIQQGVEQQMKRRKIKILSLTAHNYVHIGQENRTEDSSSPLRKLHLADEGHAIRETNDVQEMRKIAAAPPHGAEKTMGGCVSLGNGMPSSSSIPSPEDITEKKRKSPTFRTVEESWRWAIEWRREDMARHRQDNWRREGEEFFLEWRFSMVHVILTICRRK